MENEKQKIKDYQKQCRENNPLTKDKKEKIKECYINNQELILERAKNKYKSLTQDEKQKMKEYQKEHHTNNKEYQKEYQKEYRENMSDEQK